MIQSTNRAAWRRYCRACARATDLGVLVNVLEPVRAASTVDYVRETLGRQIERAKRERARLLAVADDALHAYYVSTAN
jgi:hypothetical protein